MRWCVGCGRPGLVGTGESLLDCLRDEAALLLEDGARMADVHDERINEATTRPGLEAFVRAELGCRRLAETGRDASAAASMPLAAAPRWTCASSHRAVIGRMRGG